MARTRSMTRNQNHDDEEASSSGKRPKCCSPWSDLDHNLLFLVMMRLGVVDFVSFSGVCNSWRSFAHSNGDSFMASKPPMSLSINSKDTDENFCLLEDFEGRKFKTTLPWFSKFKDCVGLTCGYLIFFKNTTRDFWLVNPITRKQLHFPDFPSSHSSEKVCRAILVFSTSLSGLVFVVLYGEVVWFCIAGKGAWSRVSYSYNRNRDIFDLYAFKGKIYALTEVYDRDTPFCLYELKLSEKRKMRKLKTKMPDKFYPDGFLSSPENLLVMRSSQIFEDELLELDFGKMEWVKPCEKTLQEYAFFCGALDRDVAVKWESWADPRSHERYADTHNDREIKFFTEHIWYFPHECMSVDRID